MNTIINLSYNPFPAVVIQCATTISVHLLTSCLGWEGERVGAGDVFVGGRVAGVMKQDTYLLWYCVYMCKLCAFLSYSEYN